MERARAAGFQRRADRAEAWHGDGHRRRRCRSRRRRCARTSRPTDATPKCAFGRDFAEDARRRDFTINALSLEPRRRRPRLHRRPRRSRRAPRAIHRRCAQPHPRGLSAHPAFLPLFGAAMARATLDADGFARRHPRARRPGASVARARARRTDEVARGAARGRSRRRRCCEAGPAGPARSRAWPIPRACGALSRSRRRARGRPIPLLRLAALALDDRRGRRATARQAAPVERRIRTAGGRGARPRSAARPARAALARRFARAAVRTRANGAQDALTLAHVDSGAAPDDPAFASAFRFLSDTPEADAAVHRRRYCRARNRAGAGRRRGAEKPAGFMDSRRLPARAGAAGAAAGRGVEGLRRRPERSTGLQAFGQAFPNLSCFSPSFSKDSFGGFVGFQGLARLPNPKSPFPNFCSPKGVRGGRGRAARRWGLSKCHGRTVAWVVFFRKRKYRNFHERRSRCSFAYSPSPRGLYRRGQGLDRPARGDSDLVEPAVSSRSAEPVALVHVRRQG